MLEFRPIARIIRGGFEVWGGHNPRGMECACACYILVYPPPVLIVHAANCQVGSYEKRYHHFTVEVLEVLSCVG